MARKKNNGADAPVDTELVIRAFAKAVAEGDIVNFKILFAPWAPTRQGTTESFDDPKYRYLLPERDENSAAFAEALERVKAPNTWAHIEGELAAKRPAQLPSELVLRLADNAVRLGKFTAAAQAYELLRARRRMQKLFYDQAMDALANDRLEDAAKGFRIGVGLAYDYAAFPEPLPAVGQYQTQALLLHAVYPTKPDHCVALLPDEIQVQAALDYLLYENEAVARLREEPIEKKLELLAGLVRLIDPDWDAFLTRYSDTCALIDRFRQRMRDGSHAETIEQQIADQDGGDPHEIMASLLGREIPGGEWWQYLRELAYRNPASALFVGRQIIGDSEIIMPRLRQGSALAARLGIKAAPEAAGAL